MDGLATLFWPSPSPLHPIPACSKGPCLPEQGAPSPRLYRSRSLAPCPSLFWVCPCTSRYFCRLSSVSLSLCLSLSLCPSLYLCLSVSFPLHLPCLSRWLSVSLPRFQSLRLSLPCSPSSRLCVHVCVCLCVCVSVCERARACGFPRASARVCLCVGLWICSWWWWGVSGFLSAPLAGDQAAGSSASPGQSRAIRQHPSPHALLPTGRVLVGTSDRGGGVL